VKLLRAIHALFFLRVSYTSSAKRRESFEAPAAQFNHATAKNKFRRGLVHTATVALYCFLHNARRFMEWRADCAMRSDSEMAVTAKLCPNVTKSPIGHSTHAMSAAGKRFAIKKPRIPCTRVLDTRVGALPSADRFAVDLECRRASPRICQLPSSRLQSLITKLRLAQRKGQRREVLPEAR